MMASKSFVFRFDDVEVREREFSLTKAGEVLTLEPKAFRALLFLLHNPQRLIPKDELIRAVWGDTAVADGSLTRSIWLMRNALGDDIRSPRYIETVPTVGYRFIAQVEEQVESDQNVKALSAAPESESYAIPGRGPGTRTFSARWIGVVGIPLALILIAAVAGPSVWHRSAAPRIHSLTVLPFQNPSAAPNTEYFANGMTEELIRELSTLPELKVVSDSSKTPLKDSPESRAEIARKLAVDAVVEGSITQSKDKVSLDIRMFGGHSNDQLWAERFEDSTRNIPALQKRMATAIASHAQLLLTPSQQAGLDYAKPLDPSAYDGYLQGRYLLSKRDFDGAVKMFRRAVVLDPDYARSWAGLAAGLAQQGMGSGPNQEPIPEAKAAAQHAIELDPNNGEAWSVLGQIKYKNELDWKDAEYDLQRGVALSPSDSTLELEYATFLALAGRGDEGVSHMRRALELDPMSFFNVRHMGSILYWTRHYDESLEYIRKAKEMEPDRVWLTVDWEVNDLAMKGMAEQAVQADFERLPLPYWQKWHDRLEAAYRSGGRKAYWETRLKLFQSLPYSPCIGFEIARVYLFLGNNDRAIETLTRTMNEGCPSANFIELYAAPIYDPIRRYPQFTDLLKRVNLGK